jgi:YfiH family protein
VIVSAQRSHLLTASPALRHGFFDRQNGVSDGDYAGLNVSLNVGDDPIAVMANRQQVADAMGGRPLIILKQVHSARVEIISGPMDASEIEADAMVTNAPGVLLGIMTADCTPVLLADPEAGIVGAAHAGWRGALDGVIANTVAAMVDLGADRARIIAAYGPTISGGKYEVGDQFRADFLALRPEGSRYFLTPPGGVPHFDLPGFVAASLAAAGVTRAEQVGLCTYSHPERYFSHRFATHRKTHTGRQIAVIGLTQL